MDINEVIELRHQLHMYPELSGEEVETKVKLIEFLKAHTELEICDRGKWFYAVYYVEGKKEAGSIAFRADMDAIKVDEHTNLEYCSRNKGVSHKCGHDGHSAALAAFAWDVWEKGCNRDVYFIFQHGEEVGMGGEPCAKLIDEVGISEVYAVHNFPSIPFGAIGIRRGTINCASKGMEIIFIGQSAHASQPENGINPAVAISEIVCKLKEIAAPERYKGLILCTVVQIDVGERAFGVAAHEGHLLLTIRGEMESEMNSMEAEIVALAKEKAEAEGLKLEFKYSDVFPETWNHPKAVDKIESIANAKGWEICDFDAPIRSSEDFGYFLKKAPGALVWLGAGEDWPAIHTEDFNFNDALLEKTVDYFWAVLKDSTVIDE